MFLDGGCDFHDVQGIFCKMVGALMDDLCCPRAIQRLLVFFVDADMLPARSATRFSY